MGGRGGGSINRKRFRKIRHAEGNRWRHAPSPSAKRQTIRLHIGNFYLFFFLLPLSPSSPSAINNWKGKKIFINKKKKWIMVFKAEIESKDGKSWRGDCHWIFVSWGLINQSGLQIDGMGRYGIISRSCHMKSATITLDMQIRPRIKYANWSSKYDREASHGRRD